MKPTAVAVAFFVFLAGRSAEAAWGGVLDGNAHPMVGALYADFNRDGQIQWFEMICSGSYAGPSKDGAADVFLTAGHCLPSLQSFGVSQLWVSFDPIAGDGGGTPEGLIAATGFRRDPRFGHDLGNLYDSGVVLLPAGSVVGIAPVELPPAGYLDDLRRAGELSHMVIEIVGYGVVPFWRLPGGTQFFFDGSRRQSMRLVIGLSKSFVRFLQNEKATDLGGLCFGDSGSPQFVLGTRTIISTTTGGNGNCNANNYNYRLDTPWAREFLGQFLDLP